MKNVLEPPPTSEETSPLGLLLQEAHTSHRRRGSLAGISLSSALEALWINRLRSLLTMLGITIGIASVIGSLMMTGGVGAYFDTVISGQGATTISITGSPQNTNGVRTNQGHPSLTDRDLLLLGRLPHVSGVSPWVQTRQQVISGNQNWNTSVVGVSTALQDMQSWEVSQGVWLSQQEQDGGEAVAVLGDTVSQHLFAPSNPVGQQIRIGTNLFRVVGVLAPHGMGAFGASDDLILVPYKALNTRLLNQNTYATIYVAADTTANVDLVSQEVTQLLEQDHHIAAGSPDDFQLMSTTQLLAQENQGTAAISAIFASIAAISLTIGGIGIMNIMLVSVTERTREIGIRMAIGAHPRDIRNQFLAEALSLCLAGAILGTLLGLFIGWFVAGAIVSAMLTTISGSSATIQVPFVITPVIVLMPVFVSLLIGVIFGLYPAIRASHLDPITAIGRAK